MGRRLATPKLRIIDHIIMQQRRSMDILHKAGNGMYLRALTTAQPSRQKQQEWSNPLASSLEQKRRNFLDKRYVRSDIAENLVFDCSEIAVVTIPHINHGLKTLNVRVTCHQRIVGV